MATALRRGTTSEDIDSDFDDSSPEDEDQQSHKESITELEDDQQAQIQVGLSNYSDLSVFLIRKLVDLSSNDNNKYFGELFRNGGKKSKLILKIWNEWNSR